VVVDRHKPPYKVAGAVLLVLAVSVAGFVFLQFRGELTPKTRLTVLSPRAGLVVDPGSKVTYNGVEIGKVAGVDYVDVGGAAKAKLTLNVEPRYIAFIPRNVVADVRATTVFGNKYISFSSPKIPSLQRITSQDVIDAASVTTEFNTVFETVMSLSEQLDPIELNATLTATAQAVTGLGERFGDSLLNANRTMDDLNPRMWQLRAETRAVADLADVYANASADLWDGLDNAATTAGTLNDQRGDIDAALLAAIGFGKTAADSLERSGPYLVRAAEDLLPTTKLLDDYRGMIFCTIRNYAEVAPRVSKVLGGDNGYALRSYGTISLPGDPFVYPENLPRVNAHGGPEGRPGCWQKVTRYLYPFPYLVMDTGYSLAPYNHIEFASPLVTEYLWGRQIGENTINP
jgi:phospholipid/cholesterol/gamma-HCH transport system substrate-binding protein